jgi:hypothetical protein
MRFCGVIIAGFGVRVEFSHSWWYECNTCREAKEKIGIWNVGKVAYNGHACWRKGMALDFSHWSTTAVIVRFTYTLIVIATEIEWL